MTVFYISMLASCSSTPSIIHQNAIMYRAELKKETERLKNNALIQIPRRKTKEGLVLS